VRFVDGTFIDTGNTDALPSVMTLPPVSELTVVLALPHEHENGGNCLQPEEKRNVRCAGVSAGGKCVTVMVMTAARWR
jgi:predicted component of type VI protein secretion system